MGTVGIWQILIIVLVFVLLFGRGKISEVMGDFAKGIKSFKKGLSEDDEKAVTDDTKSIEGRKVENVAADSTRENMRVG